MKTKEYPGLKLFSSLSETLYGLDVINLFIKFPAKCLQFQKLLFPGNYLRRYAYTLFVFTI